MKKIKLFSIIILLLLLPVFISAQEAAQDAPNTDDDNTELLSALGVFSSSNMYLTYMSLSLINDNLNNNDNFENYQKAIFSVENLIETIKENLKSLTDNKYLSTSDVDFINKMSDVFDSLKEDAGLLKKYLNSKSDEDYMAFKKKHDLVYIQLNDLFEE